MYLINLCRLSVLFLVVVFMVSGCSVLSLIPKNIAKLPTGLPKVPKDIANIPDAIPRKESRGRYGNPESYVVFGQRYRVLISANGYVERGIASWYGPGFHAERTSSGEPYDMYAMTAAHKTLPIPTYARITNLKNGRSVVVRINDRGPFVEGRIVDLSYTAAWKLDITRTGTAQVELQVLQAGTDAPPPPIIAPTEFSSPTAPTAVATENLVREHSVRYLQVGSFSALSNAESLVSRLKAAGISNSRLRELRSAGNILFRVILGPLEGPLELDDMLLRLQLIGINKAQVSVESLQ